MKKILLLLPLFFLLGMLFTHKNPHVSAQTVSGPTCGTSPSDVVLVIDRSGSMKDQIGTSGTKLANAKTAAKKFVDILAQDSRNHVGLSSFATEGTIDKQLTGNYSAVKTAIGNLTASGDTCTECGVFKGNRNITENGRAGMKKVIILLTDGRANVIQGSPNRVSTTLAENKAIAEVKNSNEANGTVFFTIGLGSDVNASFLKEIASITGGKYYASPTTDQLDSIYQQISQIIAKGSISGIIFEDLNGNGVLDSGEPNLSGWNVSLSGLQTQSVTTDANGAYSFKNLCDGAYTVKQAIKSGFTQTFPTNNNYYSLTLSGDALTDKNFGNSHTPSSTPAPPPECTENALGITVTPNGANASPGQEITYTVKVKNNDQGQDCAPSQILLSAEFGSPEGGWSLAIDPSIFDNVAPGQSVTSSLHVASPSDAPAGPKTIIVTAHKPNEAPQTFNVVYNVVVPSPSPTPTTTPSPTNEPTSVPTPISSQTILNMSVGLDGIGTTPRIPIGGNKNPLHNTRSISMEIFDATTNEKFEGQGFGTSFFYNPNTFRFEGNFNLDDTFQTGVYNIYVKSPQSLFAQLTGSINLIKGQLNTVPVINLITGNINDQDQSMNKIDLLDYQVLISCSIYSQDDTACNVDPGFKDLADLNDDGAIDEDDLTLWLKELANQQGAILPE